MRPIEYTEHGSYAFARREKCNCALCKDAIYRYAKQQRSGLAAQGDKKRVPVEPSRQHLLRLIELGADQQRIRARLGRKISRSQFANIVSGKDHRTGNPVKTVTRATERLILSLAPERAVEYDDHTLLPAIGARRRIQALGAIGWSKLDIANEWGVSEARVYLVFRYEQIKAGTLRELIEVYDRMSAHPGTSANMRWRGIREGWPPPMAWDDETIDDPNVKPDMKLIACAATDCTRGVKARGLCYGHNRLVPRDVDAREFRERVQRLKPLGANSKQVELLADVRELRDQGLQLPEVAAKLGRSQKYIDRIWYAA